MPFIIDLYPASDYPAFLRSVTNPSDPTDYSVTSNPALATKFPDFDSARAAIPARGWPDARVTEVAAEGPSDDDLAEFTRAYLTCALWASVPIGEPDSESDASLESLGYGVENCCAETTAKARADCEAFARDHYALLRQVCRIGYGWGAAGHDFFLSRNGHGAGFFDRGREPQWDDLQRAAKAWGSTEQVTENDDGTCTVL